MNPMRITDCEDFARLPAKTADRTELVAATLRYRLDVAWGLYEVPILGVSNYKGCLSVIWTRQPSEDDTKVCGEVWESFCENPENIKHFVIVPAQPTKDRGEGLDP